MGTENQVNEKLRELFVRDFGEETAERLVRGCVKRPVTLRINSLKMTAEEGRSALLKAGFSFEEAKFSDTALILHDVHEEDIRKTSLYEEGRIYLQSLSSMLPPLYLCPKEGENILDMTAAPGGKTTELAALSDGRAFITACERDRARFERLKFNIARQGAGRVTAICADALSLDDALKFDKLLLDAPCSGSGTADFTRPVRIDGEYVEKCARIQEKLLKKALNLLKRGGELVYSTCSVLKREDEDVLCSVLSGSVRLVPIRPMDGIPLLSSMEGTLRIPPTPLYEGFFLARLVKL